MRDEKKQRYVLRQAAGMYWLIDTLQTGNPYQPPVSFNHTGAAIWNMLQEEKSIEQVARKISEKHGITQEEAKEDVEQFVSQLKKSGIQYY